VHTSLLEAQIAMLDFQATRWLIDGEVPPQAGNDHPTGVPTGVFETKDGYINIAASGGRLWHRFLEVIGMPELAEDPRFAQPRTRSRNRDQLRAIIEPVLRTRTSAEWVEALNAVGVPVGPVLTIDQTFADPQVQHLDMVKTVQHPLHGALRIIRSPVNLSRTPASVRTAAPVAGADTEAVLLEYGIPAAEIERLTAAGIIGRGAKIAAGAAGDII
jgi:formyl-CoA transferase